tara:strand:+ start:9702 stop:10001 length:300 start_codon:yes stop_codon:yes gene_type:complete
MRSLSQLELRSLILEVAKSSEVKESEIKKAVINCLKKEGGAAGMNVCIQTVKNLAKGRKKLPKNLRTKKQIGRFILRMDNVVKHRYGDLILTTGLRRKK